MSPDPESKAALRPVLSTDLAAVHAINEAAVPNVNSLPIRTLDAFVGIAACFRVVEAQGAIAAFLVGFARGANYASENYRWFCRNYSDFMYIDRVAVAAAHRRKGYAGMLYRDLERAAIAPLLACEVNLHPPNAGSLEFHRRFGFREVGRQETEGGSKTVSLMVKSIGAAADRGG